MPSLVNVQATLRSAGHGHGHSHGPAGPIDALRMREVDGLVSQLLDEIEIPFTSLGKKVMGQLSDMKQVLAADYREVPGLPPTPLVKELARIVDTEINTRPELWPPADSAGRVCWQDWKDPDNFASLVKLFGPRAVQVTAEPYRRGAGLALRGFFCRATVGDKPKFVIFLNTAHHPGAVAATFAHELGHYLYGSLVGENTPMTAFMEGTFGTHLNEEHELFADALVALGAYSTDFIRQVTGADKLATGNSQQNILKRIHKVYEAIGTRMRLDLKQERISTSWRVSYLTSMIHFFKLRCALLDKAGI